MTFSLAVSLCRLHRGDLTGAIRYTASGLIYRYETPKWNSKTNLTPATLAFILIPNAVDTQGSAIWQSVLEFQACLCFLINELDIYKLVWKLCRRIQFFLHVQYSTVSQSHYITAAWLYMPSTILPNLLDFILRKRFHLNL